MVQLDQNQTIEIFECLEHKPVKCILSILRKNMFEN